MRTLAFLLASALLVTSACDNRASDKAVEDSSQPAPALGEPDYSHAGEPAPDVTLMRQDGGPLALGAFRGTRTLVNLWATWCAPCVAELPALDRLAAAKGYDMNVVAVSQDIGGWEKITPFLERVPMEHATILSDEDGALSRAYGAAGLPLTIMYDADGRELWRVNGPREWDQPGGLPGDTADAASVPEAGSGNEVEQAGADAMDAELKAEGVAWVARGQEPGWIIRLTPGETIEVEADYGEVTATLPAPDAAPSGQFALARTTGGTSFALSTTEQPCTDTMSGRPYPQTVQMQLNGKTYRGCGGAI
jgi:peroxiredoxin/uncharacterized membrane protein|tara:strand:- start:6905 stop:7825 length:921 start_codon:yes stop_codon:yes gene_type:complete